MTGYAGPDSGGTEEVGLVYIGCAVKDGVNVQECHFQGTRTQIREQAADMALRMAKEALSDENA